MGAVEVGFGALGDESWGRVGGCEGGWEGVEGVGMGVGEEEGRGGGGCGWHFGWWILFRWIEYLTCAFSYTTLCMERAEDDPKQLVLDQALYFHNKLSFCGLNCSHGSCGRSGTS